MSLHDADHPNTDFDVIKETGRREELYVGSGLKVKLEVSICDTFNLEGEVEGKVHAKSMWVTEKGKFVGDAQVECATIDGFFDGSLTVHGLLRIGETGQINGTLRYKEIEIERNGQVRGNVDIVESDEVIAFKAGTDPLREKVSQLLTGRDSTIPVAEEKLDGQTGNSDMAVVNTAKAEEKKAKKSFF